MRTMLILTTILMLLCLCSLPIMAQDQGEPLLDQQNGSDKWMIYVGTYTRGESEGIYRFQFDTSSGTLRPAGVTGGIVNPSFLALHPNNRYLYAVAEVSQGEQKSGAVSAFAIQPTTGELTPLNQQSSQGAGPCYVAVDQTGNLALVANYGGGSVAALPIQSDGQLAPATSAHQHEGSSVNPQRQAGPHAHCIVPDPSNRFAMAVDLGLDQILIYRLEENRLVPHVPAAVKLEPGAGPRHLTFHPEGRLAYVINELHSTVTALAYDPQKGTLEPLQTITTLPESFTGRNSTAEVLVHPNGRLLYGSNRGHDSIAIFQIDERTGELVAVDHQKSGGQTPRNFRIDPTGTFLLAANQQSGNIVVFRIDPQTGKLTPTGHEVKVPMPVCIKFLPL